MFRMVAATGGMLFDAVGSWSPFALSAVLLIGSSIAAAASASQLGAFQMKALTSINRRVLLGATLAITFLPRPAYGQEGRDPASQEPTHVKMNDVQRSDDARHPMTIHPRGTSRPGCPWT
jgi:hypothetical protein